MFTQFLVIMCLVGGLCSLSAVVDTELTVSCFWFTCITGVKINKIYKRYKTKQKDKKLLDTSDVL